ncbi:GUN4 domain-containing protein [Solwaraspora sp. WMMB335]|uniref:GUN4 domain-containing protein n=1 Tax=Solwaraspora sp. WMMB335 TaxID=3404118 RepID=UPI003B943436
MRSADRPDEEVGTPGPSSRDVAVVVGVDRNVNLSTSTLACAEADAVALAALFRHLGLADERILVLVGKQATRSAVMGAVAAVPQRFPDLGAADRIWFTFSGHGLIGPDGRGHLLVHDTYRQSSARLRDSVVVGEVVERLRASAVEPKPNVILLLDACRSRPIGPWRSGDLDFASALRRLVAAKPSGTVVISGCPEGQLSFEDRDRGLGVFTAAFIDLMTPDDRPRTLAELNGPLAQRVLARSRQIDVTWRQSSIIMAEPAELVEGLLLAPQRLRRDDIVELHGHSREIMDLSAAAMLFENLSHAVVHPDDVDLFANPRHRVGRSRRRRRVTAAAGLDLDRLDDLIRHGRYRDADRETLRLVLQSAGRDPQSVRTHLLSPDDVGRIATDDLLDIDECWRRHSGGRFGFLAQLEAAEVTDWDATAFANRVGWHPQDRWLYYSEARWTSAAPVGHLPILGPAGGIEPSWRVTAGVYGHALASWVTMPAAVVRQARDGTTVRQAHRTPIPEPFTWREYIRLEQAHMAEALVGVGHGRLRPLGARLAEAPVRGLLSTSAYFLSAVWAANRATLLRRLRS